MYSCSQHNEPDSYKPNVFPSFFRSLLLFSHDAKINLPFKVTTLALCFLFAAPSSIIGIMKPHETLKHSSFSGLFLLPSQGVRSGGIGIPLPSLLLHHPIEATPSHCWLPFRWVKGLNAVISTWSSLTSMILTLPMLLHRLLLSLLVESIPQSPYQMLHSSAGLLH